MTAFLRQSHPSRCRYCPLIWISQICGKGPYTRWNMTIINHTRTNLCCLSVLWWRWRMWTSLKYDKNYYSPLTAATENILLLLAKYLINTCYLCCIGSDIWAPTLLTGFWGTWSRWYSIRTGMITSTICRLPGWWLDFRYYNIKTRREKLQKILQN